MALAGAVPRCRLKGTELMNTVESIKNLFIQFGTSWVLWLLFALSAGSLLVSVERWLVFRAKGGNLRQLASHLDKAMGEEKAVDVPTALASLKGQVSVAASVARAGLRLAPRGLSAVDKGMQSALVQERKALEGRLTYLGTLGNNAPFIGLFGTVIGIILAFEELGKSATAAGNAAASQVASAAVMSAIAEALVATAVGIAVALPAVAIYNVFQRRITVLMDDADSMANLVLAYLHGGVEDKSGQTAAKDAQ